MCMYLDVSTAYYALDACPFLHSAAMCVWPWGVMKYFAALQGKCACSVLMCVGVACVSDKI